MNISRREFAKTGCKVITGAVAGTVIIGSLVKNSSGRENWLYGEYDWNEHYWGFAVDNNKCIGCGRCAYACKLENHVPFDEPWYRTWVERYRIKKEGETKIDSPDGGIDGFTDDIPSEDIKKSFYVLKLCNHCDNPPCVQVCPVGARVFGDLKDPDSAVNKIIDTKSINVHKPELGTRPKVYYVGWDREIR